MKKKIIPVLSLLGVAGAMALGAGLTSGSKALGVKADGDPVTYIAMADAGFHNASTQEEGDPYPTSSFGFDGHISSRSRTYWNEHYSHFALDDFISTGFSNNEQTGYDNEGWTGTLRSNSWKQFTPYVYFQLGGAKDYETDNNTGVRLDFHVGANTWSVYNNTFLDGRMLLRYFEIPSEIYATLDKVNGFDMYVDIVDLRTNGWGLLNFGYLHPNATFEKIGEEMRHYINNLPLNFVNDTERDHVKAAYGHYYGNGGLKAAFLQTADIADMDEHFSSNETFLKDWYFDHAYFNNNNATYYMTSAISTATYRPDDGTNMPYNNEGGFFRGWRYEDGGFVSSDAPVYRFKSRPFVLPADGSGLISVKMANRASLHVIDADDPANSSADYDFAWIDNRKNNTSGDQWDISTSGANYCTLVRHVINLEHFKGKKIQLAIADVTGDGWGAAYFDEVIVNYGANTGFAVDKVVQNNSHGVYYNAIPDVYVNKAFIENDGEGITYTAHTDNKPTSDTGDRKAAYDFLKSYYTLARGGEAFCNVYTGDSMKTLLGTYNGLSETAKRIVCASKDFSYGGVKVSTVEPTITSMSSSLDYLFRVNDISGVTYSNLSAGKLMNSASWTISIILLVSGIAFIGLFLFFRKKHQKE